MTGEWNVDVKPGANEDDRKSAQELKEFLTNL